MNYLALCQRAYTLLRAGEQKIGSAPTTVADAQGINLEIAAWIKQSDLDIQNEKEAWLFMRKEGLLPFSEGVSMLQPSGQIGDFGELALADNDWRDRYVMIYRESRADETPVRYVPWEQWQFSVYDRGDRGQGRPVRMTLRPDGQIQVDPVPESPYIMRLPYRRTQIEMTQNTDESPIPARYRMAIVWWAIARYYCVTRDGSGEFLVKAEKELLREMNRLYQTQLPEFTVPDGLFL